MAQMTNNELPGDDMRPEGAASPTSQGGRTRKLGPGCDGGLSTARPGSL